MHMNIFFNIHLNFNLFLPGYLFHYFKILFIQKKYINSLEKYKLIIFKG
jgi:hypothetical protein